MMSRATTSKGQSPKAQMDLRVFSGIHAGAEVRLPERGILMIGRADDCDLIISDPGIAEHHCVLTVVDDQVLLRTLEGRVEIEGGDGRRRGENVTLEHFHIIHLGERVSMAVGPHWSERWQKLVDAAGGNGDDGGAPGVNRRVLWMAGGLLAIAALVLFGGWSLIHESPSVVHQVEQKTTRAHQILASMSLSQHVRVSNQADGTLVLSGVVGSPEELRTLKQRLQAAGLSPQMQVRDWPSVKQEVETVFAMYGHEVQVKLDKRSSAIIAFGHFGNMDADKLKTLQGKVFGSPEMQQLDRDIGSLKADIVDYDAKDEPPPGPDPDKAIRQVKVDADGMPYIITEDLSHYYPNSELPGFGKFIGAYPEDGTVLIELPNHKVMQLRRRTKYRELEPEDTHAGPLLPASAASASGVIQQVPLQQAFGADATHVAPDSPAPESSHVH